MGLITGGDFKSLFLSRILTPCLIVYDHCGHKGQAAGRPDKIDFGVSKDSILLLLGNALPLSPKCILPKSFVCLVLTQLPQLFKNWYMPTFFRPFTFNLSEPLSTGCTSCDKIKFFKKVKSKLLHLTI